MKIDNLLPWVKKSILPFILLIGIAIRVIVFFQGRSFIIDEANLARNIAERSFVALFEPLSYQQYAPPLYACVLKLATLVGGMHSATLTFISLLAGCTGLWVFAYWLNRRSLSLVGKVYGLGLMSFSFWMIRYSTECKQYGLDVLLTVLVLFGFEAVRNTPIGFRLGIGIGVLGAVLVWLSMPIVFLLAAFGLSMLIFAWQSKRNVWPVLGMIGLWLLSFGLYFFLLLKGDASSAHLRAYHSAYFFYVVPLDLAQAQQSGALLLGLFRTASDATAISLGFSILTFCIGAIYLWKRDKRWFFIGFSPIVFCLIAANLGYYSLIPRMILFLMPIFWWFMAQGMDSLWHKMRNWKWLLLVPLVISLVNAKGYTYLWKKMEFEDIKMAMDYLQAHREEDEFLYVHWDATAAFSFYNDYNEPPYRFRKYKIADYGEQPLTLMASSDSTGWLLFSHVYPKENVQLTKESIAAETVIIDSLSWKDAQVYKFHRRVN